MFANEATSAFLITTVILALVMWFCGTVTTYVRGKTMASPNPEDDFVMRFFNGVFFVKSKGFVVLPSNEENDETVNRWLRICNNNVANIPISLIIFFLALKYSSFDSSFLSILIWVFLGGRLCHTFFYAFGLQPFRTISYSIASISMMVTALSLVF